MTAQTYFTDPRPALAIARPAQTVPQHDARSLTAGGHLAQIDLDGQLYTLRITRAGKLILTK
ncbi:hemin uptake protein HemP [Paenirhodobacter enshiensis]|uniref:hemin uptake protein HemP n=1 Tax=Paenirhodobacter enshiensis TaxID=1105367 RepID=UPI000562F7BD|nr:hemin uptake protein HemP [Paenirhodobacter enshiensis]